ncbi:hypothetical protein ACVWYH_004668 [Bradyrhizobium sp. GM24.11]
MSAAATPRRIWLCADDYGISPGVNRAIRDLIERGRLNATSVMMVGPAIERGEIDALQAAAKTSPRCAIGLHVTLSAPFRPLTMHFRPLDGDMFMAFPKLLRAGLMRRLDREFFRNEVRAQLAAFAEAFGRAPPTSSTAISMCSCFRKCATALSMPSAKQRLTPGCAKADATCRWRSGWLRRKRWCSMSSAHNSAAARGAPVLRSIPALPAPMISRARPISAI